MRSPDSFGTATVQREATPKATVAKTMTCHIKQASSHFEFSSGTIQETLQLHPCGSWNVVLEHSYSRRLPALPNQTDARLLLLEASYRTPHLQTGFQLLDRLSKACNPFW